MHEIWIFGTFGGWFWVSFRTWLEALASSARPSHPTLMPYSGWGNFHAAEFMRNTSSSAYGGLGRKFQVSTSQDLWGLWNETNFETLLTATAIGEHRLKSRAWEHCTFIVTILWWKYTRKLIGAHNHGFIYILIHPTVHRLKQRIRSLLQSCRQVSPLAIYLARHSVNVHVLSGRAKPDWYRTEVSAYKNRLDEELLSNRNLHLLSVSTRVGEKTEICTSDIQLSARQLAPFLVFIHPYKATTRTRE